MAESTPWNSIAESLVEFGESHLPYGEAVGSPCATCSTSPCCTHLPLHSFQLTTMTELDHAKYALNFERIELGLSATGEWSIYYCYPCRFLDQESFDCRVHDTVEQPQICIHYNPYACWYKRQLTKSIDDAFLRIDRQRMDYILSHVMFDEFRNIVQVPDWGTMMEEFTRLPLETPNGASDPPDDDSASAGWRDLVLNGASREPQPVVTFGYEALRNPCDTCEAHCCTTVVFPQPIPTATTNLDYLKFCLGFPGIELGIADDTWSLIVKSTCRYLKDKRCSVHGQPEMPIICRYYDEWKCTYRTQFGASRPPGFLRITQGQFQWLTECFRFDENGVVIQAPHAEAIRTYIEDRWRSSRRTLDGPSPHS